MYDIRVYISYMFPGHLDAPNFFVPETHTLSEKENTFCLTPHESSDFLIRKMYSQYSCIVFMCILYVFKHWYIVSSFV